MEITWGEWIKRSLGALEKTVADLPNMTEEYGHKVGYQTCHKISNDVAVSPESFNSVIGAIRQTGSPIPEPGQLNEKALKDIREVLETHYNESGRYPTVLELAKSLNKAPRMVVEIVRNMEKSGVVYILVVPTEDF